MTTQSRPLSGNSSACVLSIRPVTALVLRSISAEAERNFDALLAACNLQRRIQGARSADDLLHIDKLKLLETLVLEGDGISAHRQLRDAVVAARSPKPSPAAVRVEFWTAVTCVPGSSRPEGSVTVPVNPLRSTCAAEIPGRETPR